MEGVGDGPGSVGGGCVADPSLLLVLERCDFEAVELEGCVSFSPPLEEGYEPPAVIRDSSSRSAINLGSQTDLDLFRLLVEAGIDNPSGTITECGTFGS